MLEPRGESAEGLGFSSAKLSAEGQCRMQGAARPSSNLTSSQLSILRPFSPHPISHPQTPHSISSFRLVRPAHPGTPYPSPKWSLATPGMEMRTQLVFPAQRTETPPSAATKATTVPPTASASAQGTMATSVTSKTPALTRTGLMALSQHARPSVPIFAVCPPSSHPFSSVLH